MPRVGFTMGFVSSKTGLSPHVLRAWERRYQAVSPNRSAGGQRLYSQADIQRLMCLKRAVDRGHSISTIAALDSKALVDLVGPIDKPHSPAATANPDANHHIGTRPSEMVDTCLEAVKRLNADRLHQTLQAGELVYSRPVMIEQVIRPLLEAVGQLWSDGSLRIVHGHTAASVVHARLHTMLVQQVDGESTNPSMAVATPGGQRCYLGALAVAVTAQDHGWKATILGDGLPAEEIAAACSELHPRLLALSITCRADRPSMCSELDKLSTFIDDSCRMVIGGRASRDYRQHIEKRGGAYCATMSDLIDLMH